MSALFHNFGVSRVSDSDAVPQTFDESDGLSGSTESEPDHFTIRRLCLPLLTVDWEIFVGLPSGGHRHVAG